MRSKGVLNLFTNGILLPIPVRSGILEAFTVVSLFSLSVAFLPGMTLGRGTTGC